MSEFYSYLYKTPLEMADEQIRLKKTLTHKWPWILGSNYCILLDFCIICFENIVNNGWIAFRLGQNIYNVIFTCGKTVRTPNWIWPWPLYEHTPYTYKFYNICTLTSRINNLLSFNTCILNIYSQCYLKSTFILETGRDWNQDS